MEGDETDEIVIRRRLRTKTPRILTAYQDEDSMHLTTAVIRKRRLKGKSAPHRLYATHRPQLSVPHAEPSTTSSSIDAHAPARHPLHAQSHDARTHLSTRSFADSPSGRGPPSPSGGFAPTAEIQHSTSLKTSSESPEAPDTQKNHRKFTEKFKRPMKQPRQITSTTPSQRLLSEAGGQATCVNPAPISTRTHQIETTPRTQLFSPGCHCVALSLAGAVWA